MEGRIVAEVKYFQLMHVAHTRREVCEAVRGEVQIRESGSPDALQYWQLVQAAIGNDQRAQADTGFQGSEVGAHNR